MAYIDWLIDGVQYRTYCGKLNGCIVASNGQIEPLSDPTIEYFGDDLNVKLPCNKVWKEVKIKTQNDEWYACNITTYTSYQIIKSTGYMTNTSVDVKNTEAMPTVTRPITMVDVKYYSNYIITYSPELYAETYIDNLGTSKAPPYPIGNVGGIRYDTALGHYMLFILHNKLGVYPQKEILCSMQPYTLVASQLAYNFVENLSAPAKPWGVLPLHFKLRLFWDKKYTKLKNTTDYAYRYSDNKNMGYNINWMSSSTNIVSQLTESNCGRVIYQSMMSKNGIVERNFGRTVIMKNVPITSITNVEDVPPPDNGDGEQPPDDNPTGDRDDTSDDIDFPKPILNINDFITIYNFKQEQLKLLANNIWDNNFLDNLLKISNYALDCIICFNAYNFDIETDVSEHVTIGNVQFDMGAQKITNAYQTVNMGAITIMPFFGDYRDYTNTNIYIYLPFIGMKQLDVEQVQGNKITLKYIVDVLTGECLAMIKVTNNKFNSVTQSFKGKCNYAIPLGGENYSRLNTDIAHGILTKSLTGFIGGTISAFERAKQVSIGNNLGGNIALANVLTPYLLFERYDTLSTQNWSQWENWNSYYIESLSNVTGLTKARTSNLIIPLAQENEINEIKQLLEQGVVF